LKIQIPFRFKGFNLPLWGGLILVLSINACSPKTKIKAQEPYFDLKSYFEEKESEFSRNKIPLFKTLIMNGITQNRKIVNPEWNRELVFFIEADINKPAWAGKFESQWKEGNLTYKALDTNKINIRRVDFFHFNPKDSSFDSVRIIKKETNYLSNLQVILVYKPDSAYSVRYNQDIRFYQGSHYSIQVKIKP